VIGAPRFLTEADRSGALEGNCFPRVIETGEGSFGQGEKRAEARGVDVEAIARELNLKILTGTDKLKTHVHGGYAGDLLSDVMANSKKGDIWITRQTHPNIVAVASLKEHAGIVLTAGSEPAQETLERAAKEGIPLLLSDLPAFDVAGRLYTLITEKENKPSLARQ